MEERVERSILSTHRSYITCRDGIGQSRTSRIDGRPPNDNLWKSNCPWCVKAIEELQLRGVDFDYIDLEEIKKTAAEVTGRKDVKTVPQIYIEGRYIGGYEDLMLQLETDIDLGPIDDGDECRACEG